MQKYFALVILILCSCSSEKTIKLIDYEAIVKEVFKDSSTVNLSDSADLFDQTSYNPSEVQPEELMAAMEQFYEEDSARIKNSNDPYKEFLDLSIPIDAGISNPNNEYHAKPEEKSEEEIKALKYNLKQLHAADSILHTQEEYDLKQIDCRVWAQVDKSDQRMYLHIDGQIVDTFLVSTGSTKSETPLFDMRPRGPIFQKYTSRKYPGGDWKGLGNMPYCVFISGGYAVHGTTRGNIRRLGKKASHGCIRMHPDNGKIFNELVRQAGLENTWISVQE